ncbi:MAG: ribonuclease HI family protein [Candidatus Magasanikbacteria bacterium]|nr:ribonuclease HI family protein [Candidatus Magasanikbacteria bacterium]
MKLTIFTDGGARGNPGPAAAGVVIKNEKSKILAAFGRYLGETTNNQAEYHALILALEHAWELGGTEITCFADSELMVKQLNREYRVRDKDLAPLFLKIWNLSTRFKKISYGHIPREKNKEADELVNQALDDR